MQKRTAGHAALTVAACRSSGSSSAARITIAPLNPAPRARATTVARSPTNSLPAMWQCESIMTGQVEITVTDPKVLKAPITATQHLVLIPDGELIEYYCTENEKDMTHYAK